MHSLKTLTAIAFCAALSQTVNADEMNTPTGPFIDASVGTAGVEFDDIRLAEDGDYNNDGTVASVRGGYWFNRNWGVGASYAELGTIEQKFVGGTRLRGDGESFGVSVMGRLPIAERWALIGKLNVNRATLDDNGSTLGAAQIKEFTGEKTSVGLGAEVHYSMTDRTSLFVEFDGRGAVSDKVGLGYAGVGVRVGF